MNRGDIKIFDSRDVAYRRPFGALSTGQTLDLTFMPPRIWGAQRVVLEVFVERQERRFEVPLRWQGCERQHDVYTGSLPTDGLLGLVWYCFRIERGDRAPFYYGNNEQSTGGEGAVSDTPKGYQLTVYQQQQTPEWFGRGVTYHIFPDRFARSGALPDVSGMIGSRWLHTDWNEQPYFLPNEHGEVLNNDFFGGNIAGLTEKLDYIASLGVDTIYLSPIFEAASNHRYDTADYLNVDPLFGTSQQFEQLCAAARKRKLRVLLDGVFNHTGYDSRYFNGRGSYDELGAHQSQQSPYLDWYDFRHWPNDYASWWGIYTLPQVNEHSQSLCRFLFDDPGVVRHWLRAGADGWRLDVVDELPDEFVARLCAAARDEKKDAVIIGEVWEDASNKTAYGQRRKYFDGNELDGVMNYPLRNALLNYLLGGSSADFQTQMESLRENYPHSAYYSAMNFLGTHDTPRVLTVLGASPDDYTGSKTDRAHRRLSDDQRRLAVSRLKLGSLLLYCFPGSPCLFYGDEAGMEGYEDPLNRATYPWGREDAELLAHYRLLGQLRRSHAALQQGDIAYHDCGDAVLCFSRSLDGATLTVLTNNSDQPKPVQLPWLEHAKDLLTGADYCADDGLLTVELPAYSALLLQEV